MDVHERNLSPDDADDDGFTSPRDDGLSLDDLSLDQLGDAFAALLASGEYPYAKAAVAADATDASDLAHADVLAEAAADESAADDPCEITPRSIFEAMLFVGRPNNAPLTTKEVASLMRGVRPDEIVALVDELNAAYDERGCPYKVVPADAGYRLALREEFGGIRDLVLGRLREARLSQAAIDVMAIVAYHQPVMSEEVTKLRGKSSGTILAQLVRRQLLRIDRSADQTPGTSPSRAAVTRYVTTQKFLEFFGIENLDELPRPQDVERR
jgi:segregation and condensation protein B